MNTPNGVLQPSEMVMILTGIIVGTIGRFITLKIDYRQTPSYPNGYFIHLVAGFIASALGAVAVPALMGKDFAAVTFLALAIEHLRDVRRIEAESLEKLESTEFATRGAAYIDGIAKTFEARNYISLLTSFAAVLAMVILDTGSTFFNIALGTASGLLIFYALRSFTKGKQVGDICTIKPGKITVDGSELYVDDIFVSNLLGSDQSRELFLKEGAAVIIEPGRDEFRITLESFGQRQAILFELLRTFGVKRYHFTRRSFSTGKIIIAFIPVIQDTDRMIEVVKKTPILENSRKIRRIIKWGMRTGSASRKKED